MVFVTELESETPRPNALKRKIRKDEEGRYQTNCIRINNNMLEKLDGFSQMMNHLLIDPENLVWIDLSQNELQHIDPVRYRGYFYVDYDYFTPIVMLVTILFLFDFSRFFVIFATYSFFTFMVMR